MYRKRVYAKKASSVSKKTYKKRKAVVGVRSFASVGVLRSNPLQTVLPSKLRFSAGGVINPGTLGAIATTTYKLNSMFAHQPSGYDQLALLYQRYRVESAKIEFKVAADSFTFGSNGSFMMGIMITDTATPPGGYRQSLENGMTAYDLIPAGADGRGSVSVDVNMANLVGRVKSDDELSALVTADPAKIIYCHLFIQAVNSALDISAIGFSALIEFNSKFLEPIQVAASS